MRKGKFGLVAILTLLTPIISGCGENKERESHLTAAEVCASSLDQTAVRSLERMGETEKFDEASKGQLDSFTLERAYQRLNSRKISNTCYVTRAETKTDHPLIHVKFYPAPSHPEPSQDDTEGDIVNYPFGAYAGTINGNSAALYFKCMTGNEKKMPYIWASLYSAPDERSKKATSKDLMIILNSMSRALAKHIGCADEAGLPAQVPAPSN
ncbi:hypothetical protein [Streptomyces sp. SHP 1-2]|uniref:hypothetical protein n=1 Tax=Streptomyces sp. SHP 1-2 TaxID=2769489 RepID=UPI0022384203|nr:hypothetical protein [Streptomyces sp. SHP 1-2]MCW5254461.1 hypothetical protein [Streptomyces sp. SHP 1-2]